MKLHTFIVALTLIVIVNALNPLEILERRASNHEEGKRSVEGVHRACTSLQNLCTTVGKSCGLTSNTEYTSCANSFCLINSTDSVYIGRCTAYYAVGADCPSGNECSETATCLTGKCAAVTYTRTLNQDCDNARQCAGILQCTSSVCVNGASAGQSCASVPCGPGTDCNQGASPSICVVVGTLAAGAACSDTDQCIAGYYCGPGVCTKASASNTACDSDSDCTVAGEECSCADNAKNSTCYSPETYTQKEIDLRVTAENCIAKNNCGEDTIYSTCNCKSQVCNYVDFIIGTLSYPKSLYPCLGIDDMMNYCSSASSMAVGGVLIFFCVFVSFFAL